MFFFDRIYKLNNPLQSNIQDYCGIYKDENPESVGIAPQMSEVCCSLWKSWRKNISVMRNKHWVIQGWDNCDLAESSYFPAPGSR